MTRTIITFAAIVAALSIIGTAAASGTARDPRVPALQRSVSVLAAKVGALQAQVNQNATVINHEIDLATCRWTFQSHFNYGVLNIFAALIGSDGYADQTPSDNGACQRVGINPPRTFASVGRSPFNTLVGLQARVLDTSKLSAYRPGGSHSLMVAARAATH